MTINLYKNDLPNDFNISHRALAIDTETMGLNPIRDRLCLVQISTGDGDAHLVQFDDDNYEAPNLKKLLTDPNSTKIFHFARFDIAVLYYYLDIMLTPLFCTKIASRLTRTYTDRHGLKDLCREVLDVEISKQQQSSDWGAETLSEEQLHYAAADVLYLHQLKTHFDSVLEREDRTELAQKCFELIPTRDKLELLGWYEDDIMSH
ncbi:MAG: ribonuclease D [Pseudomonadota bacterium]